MSFIGNAVKTPCIGDWVITTRPFGNYYGRLEPGTKVQITDITDRGFTIQDADGNLMSECGWTL